MVAVDSEFDHFRRLCKAQLARIDAVVDVVVDAAVDGAVAVEVYVLAGFVDVVAVKRISVPRPIHSLQSPVWHLRQDCLGLHMERVPLILGAVREGSHHLVLDHHQPNVHCDTELAAVLVPAMQRLEL